MHQITECPICNNNQFIEQLTCQDYTCSNEHFKIVSCTHCKFFLTNPRPAVEDLGKYYNSEQYISHSDTSSGWINRLYKIVRNFTLKHKVKFVRHWMKNEGRLLDIGSGAGYFVNACNKHGIACMGIEPDQKTRERSVTQFSIDCRPESELDHLSNESFDAITLWHVLEHVPDLNKRMQQIHRLLKPNACAIIAVPNHLSFDAQHYQHFWAGYDVPRHLWHFSELDLQNLAQKHGFSMVQILPMNFDAFYVAMLSEKYKQSTLSFIKGIVIGMISNLISWTSKSHKSSSQIYVLKKS